METHALVSELYPSDFTAPTLSSLTRTFTCLVANPIDGMKALTFDTDEI